MCTTAHEKSADSIKIRAIKPGGFYTVIANYRFYAQEFAKLEEPFYMTIQWIILSEDMSKKLSKHIC